MIRTLLALILLTQAWGGLHAQSAADSIRRMHRKTPVPSTETGVASYYHSKFQGRPTASGEKYDQEKMTAAHNRLPLGTRIKVTNLRNKRSVIVRVNDRLHHRNTRLVDLSRAAAAKLGYIGRGITRVRVEVLKD
ncbi:MAG: septal ring lytic transglycosylase RlpA family protein [Chitinophagaceae bacterium]|nr:septal ring lytic transglycosylase RlpA family protein [Chitinophagaceae bacterium]